VALCHLVAVTEQFGDQRWRYFGHEVAQCSGSVRHRLIHQMKAQYFTGNSPYSNRAYSVGLAVMFWNTRYDRRRDRAARRIILPGRQAESEGHHGDELPISAAASDVRDTYAVHPDSEAMFNFVLALRSGSHRPRG
jgi:hypothetical protein